MSDTPVSFAEMLAGGVTLLDEKICETIGRVAELELWRRDVEQAHSEESVPAIAGDDSNGASNPEADSADDQPAAPKPSQVGPPTTGNSATTDLSQLDAPEPPPLSEAGAGADRRRSPVEMVEAILSNLVLCIDADDVPKPVIKRLLEAQRWALILKKQI